MLHYHNVFDQLRNLVTMPSASSDARDDGAAAPPEEPAVPAPAAPAKAASPARSKSEILKAWEKSYAQGRLAFGPVNGANKENGEGHEPHVGASAAATILRGPNIPRADGPVAKVHPQPAVILKPLPTLGSTGAANGQSTVDSVQRNHTGAPIFVPSNGVPAPHMVPGNNRPRRLFTPESGSLFDIILKNPRSRLFTRPMGWLSDHTSHLNVTWHPHPTIASTPFPFASLSAYYDANNTHADINRIFLPSTRDEAPVCDALPHLYPHGSLLWQRADAFAEMRLWFDSRVYRFALRVESLWRWPLQHDAAANASFMTESTLDAWSDSDGEGIAKESPEPHCGKPMLAYVGREWLRGLRSRHMRVPTGLGNARNDPVARLCLLQEKQLMPEDPERDPRFVSILIAMAQEHVYPAVPAPARFPGTVPPRMEATPEFRDVTVRLLVHDLEGDFIVYKATVSADFLRRFHYPSQAFARGGAAPGLEVEVTRVAESPRTGLRERLGAALGEEVVGGLFREGELRDGSERLTPDTERWTPMPEDVVPTAENGGSPDGVGAGDSEGTPKAGTEGLADGVDADEEAENIKPAGPLEVPDNTARGKRQRGSEIPCSNGTGDGFKKRRLSEEESTTIALSN